MLMCYARWGTSSALRSSREAEHQSTCWVCAPLAMDLARPYVKKKSKRQFHLSSAIYAALQFYLSSLYISSPSTRKCDDAVLNTILLFTGDIRYDGVLCGSAWNGTKQLNGMAIQEIYAEEKTTFSCRYFSIAMWFISIKGLRAGLDLVLHKCWTYSKFFLLH